MGFGNSTFKYISVCQVVIVLVLALANLTVAQTGITSPNSKFGAQVQQPDNTNPYKLSSRVHLQSGTNKGYLVVQVDLAKGSHIYSLTQKGNVRPTTLSVAKSKQFRLLGKFSPDRAAEVVKFDPAFKQRVEKHKKQVQFFVPIEVASGTDLSKLAPEVTINGQVCTEQNVCMPILGEKIKGKFSGYFQRTAKQSQAPQSAGGRQIR